LPLRIRFPNIRSRNSRSRASKGVSLSAANVSRIVFYGLISCLAILTGWVCFSYVKYSRIADEKLLQGPFPNSSMLFAAPRLVGVGDEATQAEIARKLKESGYEEDAKANPVGWYHLRPDAIEIFPGNQSKTDSEPGVIRIRDSKIASIIALSDNSQRTEYSLEPALLSALFDKHREKRRIVKFEDVPPVLVNAVVSIEDKRFFQHSGFDPIRFVKAVLVDLHDRRRAQGASTLTQQLAKMLWLDPRKTFGRKFDELLITVHLEQKLSKQKIFEYYANQVPLGRRGSFGIRGFGEASQAFFGKDMKQLTLAEAATLAGLIQEPSARNPFHWPDRAKTRRNIVLKLMFDNGYISQSEYTAAISSPMVVTQQGIESTDAPYFVDRVNEILGDQFGEHDFQESGSRIYTTIDLDLQRDAAAAIDKGIREIDEILTKRHSKDKDPIDAPQVALICLDPHTGEVKALVGGRNYGMSQLDHTKAERPSGSIFKPFVYAAALNTGLSSGANVMTTSSVVDDSPKTFAWDGDDYAPTDYHKSAWAGQVTLRTAFARSLNVPAVEVAEQAGYRNVADLAHKAGLENIRATPSMALGSYSVTALEMAGAYTVFANDGVMVSPRLISHIVDKSGKDIWTSEPDEKRVLDPRVNFLVVSLMQDVLRWGTGAGAAKHGFTLPAAAKTGTSHDAWFAGFTSNLLCVVWVGLDDYKDVKMDGAQAALPIWAEFMRRAHLHRAYRSVKPFSIPEGIVTAQVDNGTGQLATGSCPPNVIRTEYYLVGTAPTQFCPLHSGGTEVGSWQESLPNVPATGLPGIPVTQAKPLGPLPPTSQLKAPVPQEMPEAAPQGDPNPQKDKPQPKKGLFEKLKRIFH
jgi:penicillin-binding protein 1B